MKNTRQDSNNHKKTGLTFDFVIEVLLMAMIFLTPVIFDRRLGIVFSGTKIAWLRALMVVTMSVWAIKLIVTGKHRFFRSVLDWPVVSFLFTTTIATLTAVHVYTSFVGFYGRYEGLTTWYIYGLLFFLVTNFIHSKEQLKRIIATVIPAAILMSVYGVIQRHELDPYMWGGVNTFERVIGTIGQPNFEAAYILMAFFLTLILFLEQRKEGQPIEWTEQIAPLSYFIFGQVAFLVMIYTLDAQDVLLWYIGWTVITAASLLFAFTYNRLHPLVLRILLAICLLLIYICLLYTQSRGGYMGFFTGGVLFAIIAGRKWLLENWKKLTLIGALIVLVSAVTMLNPENSPFKRFTSEISVKSESQPSAINVKSESQPSANSETQLELKGAAGSRGETWKSAFKIIADNPLFGIGPEDLKMVFPRYETDVFRFKEAFHVKQDRCHNETFDVPVTKGLITFFIYLWLLVTLFRTGIAKGQKANEDSRLMIAGIMAAILAYLVQNQFSFGVVAITSLFWVLWGLIMKIDEEINPESAEIKLDWEQIPWLPVAGVGILTVALIYFAFLSFRADIYFKIGKTYLEGRNIPPAIENLEHSLAILPFEGNTISHLGISYLNTGRNNDAVNILKYGNAVDPFNADNFHMLSRIYLSYYDHGIKDAINTSLDYTDKALKIDPYYAEVYETQGMIYERLNQLPKAEDCYEKAFHVNPTMPGPIGKIYEISAKIGAGAKAKSLFEKAARQFPDNLEIFKVLEKYQ